MSVADAVGDAVFEETHQSMIMVRDIELYSMCEHHLLPFFGRAHVAYIPNGKILGLSKVARIVDVFARRLQVQERMTDQIADAVMDVLRPTGVGVVIEAAHFCMMMRGVAEAELPHRHQRPSRHLSRRFQDPGRVSPPGARRAQPGVTALAGRLALVTGASRGIGAATAAALADAGARVVRVARRLAGRRQRPISRHRLRPHRRAARWTRWRRDSSAAEGVPDRRGEQRRRLPARIARADHSRRLRRAARRESAGRIPARSRVPARHARRRRRLASSASAAWPTTPGSRRTPRTRRASTASAVSMRPWWPSTMAAVCG